MGRSVRPGVGRRKGASLLALMASLGCRARGRLSSCRLRRSQLHQASRRCGWLAGELIPVLWLDADRLPVAKQFFELFCFCAKQPGARRAGCFATPAPGPLARASRGRDLRELLCLARGGAPSRHCGAAVVRAAAAGVAVVRWPPGRSVLRSGPLAAEAQHPIAALPFTNGEQAVVICKPQVAGATRRVSVSPWGHPDSARLPSSCLSLWWAWASCIRHCGLPDRRKLI